MPDNRPISIDQGMNGTMNLTIDGEAIIMTPTREDVARLESKLDRALALIAELVEAIPSNGPVTLEDEREGPPNCG